MKKLNNKLYNWIPVLVFVLFVIIIGSAVFRLLGHKSYVNEYTKQHYSIVISNDTLDEIDKVDLSIVNMKNEKISLITDYSILPYERRKLSLYIKDEDLLQFSGSSYNVALTCKIKNEEYTIPTGYFTSEWGGFHVIEVNKNSTHNYDFDYKQEKDMTYRKFLKRHYNNPYETSWTEK